MRFATALLSGLLALSPLLAAPATAQSWPSRPIKVIVPFPAGGVADIGARLVGQKLGEALGQTMVIENRAGASGTLGVDAAIKSPPDGYTILITTGDFITVPSLMPATTYDPYKDLIPVTRIAIAPLLLLTNPAQRAHVGQGRDRARPRPSPASSPSARRATAPSTRSRPSGSRSRPASSCCTCPIAAARRWRTASPPATPRSASRRKARCRA